MKKKNAFTLIELIAVLVILAVIVLIATPLVLNIVKKAKDSANKRSVDAYGKATELAVATYLLDNGDYPTTIDDLTIEYSGNEVVCNVKNLNEDGSIYLSECSVNGIEVKDNKNEDGWYHYGKVTSGTYTVYNIGDVVTYNGMEFYVIASSDATSDSVTLLKAEPLTVDEVNTYGAGHVNMYSNYDLSASDYQTAANYNGYGGMAYYSSTTCGHQNPTVGSTGVDTEYIITGCTNDYNVSEIKYVVDAWSVDKLTTSDLKEDSLGYKTRLLTHEELTANLGYATETGTISPSSNGETPSWVYNINYSYWTMNAYEDTDTYVWHVNSNGNMYSSENSGSVLGSLVVRPVINLLKSAI